MAGGCFWRKLLVDQRVQRLDVVELLQRLPIWGKNFITIFAVDQSSENYRQIPARRSTLFAGVCRQARFFGQPGKLIYLIGVKMAEPDRHRSQPHDRTIAAGPVGSVAGSEGVFLGDEVSQRTSGGDPDVEASTVHGILAGLPPLNVTVGSLWTAILLGSILGLFYPLSMSSLLLIQVIYKTLWLIVFVMPRLLKGRSREVPWGISMTFLVIVVSYPWVIPWGPLFGI